MHLSFRYLDALENLSFIGGGDAATVFLVSFEPEYQLIYPFYDRGSISHGLVRMPLQFFALEFFFPVRGSHESGHYGTAFIMVIPYCMITFPRRYRNHWAHHRWGGLG